MSVSVVDVLQPEQAPPPAMEPDRKVSYEFTPADTMTETLNISAEGTPPKKRVQKIKEETPIKESFAGSKSQEVHCRASIEFIRPASARRNKTRSSVFDNTPPPSTPRRVSNGISKYECTPADTMTETLNISAEGTPPKKKVQKMKEETPVKKSFAGSKSQDVHCRDSIEFTRPASARRNKNRSSVFDNTPPKSTPRRIPNGIGGQRYSRSPYATHEPMSNGKQDGYRPTTPFAQHNHVTEQQVFSPRRERTITPMVKTPVPPPFVRPPPGGYSSNIFG
ncbi:uncharacterized protein LOC134822932 isoform X1 [Bolinopsis microptera]|uniref:uncharacterized protein LOC134822932 isoform X1 n=1 Tax=Bolinopsis microptera TaxID=2820187 RepID=UPI0030793AE7